LMMKGCIAFGIVVLAAQACKKDNNNNGGDTTNGGSGGDSSSTCSAKKADAENIAIFPADNAWNKDISASAIDPYNTQIITALGSYTIKADFGSGLWEGAPIGIPYVVVCGSQTKYPVTFRANADDDNYGDESDPGPDAIPLNAPVEGNGVG